LLALAGICRNFRQLLIAYHPRHLRMRKIGNGTVNVVSQSHLRSKAMAAALRLRERERRAGRAGHSLSVRPE
jgi:hypothetical protein